MKKNLFFYGAATIVAGMLMVSCGGSNPQDASKEMAASIPTDGIMKDLPKLTYEEEVYKAQVNKKEQEIRESGAKDEKIRQELEILRREKREFVDANAAQKKEARKQLEGVELPCEVEDGVPFKITKNFTFHLNTFKAEGEYTADVSEQDSWSNYTLQVLDKDGNIIYISEQVFFTEDGRPRKAGGKGYSSVVPNINGSNAEGWAKVDKVVIKKGTKEERDAVKAQLKEKFDAFRQSLK